MKDLRPILDEAIRATRAERGFVILAGDNLEFLAARSAEGTDLKAHAQGVSRSIIRETLASGQARLAHDSDQDTIIDARISVRVLGLRALLCAPMSWEGVVLGVLYLDSPDREVFSEGDLPTVGTYADRLARLLS